jgi:predicted amidohydrolase YtcJ
MTKIRRPSRRKFLGAMSASALLGDQRTEPDLALYNANILTVDAGQPRAQAVAIAGGRFFAVGSNDDVRRLARAGARQIDIGGKTVVPGFIDAHTHPSYAGIRHLRWVDCDLRSIADIQKAIRERAAKTPAVHSCDPGVRLPARAF